MSRLEPRPHKSHLWDRFMLESAHLPPFGGAMFLRRLPIFSLLLVLGLSPANAQNTQNVPNRHSIFSIGGSVRDGSTQREMEGIQVVLKQATGTPITTAFTRDNGDFQFDGLGNGDYIIEISVRDYERFQQEVAI